MASMEIPNVYTQRLCGVLLNFVTEREVHDMWRAASILHPGLKNLRFVMDSCGYAGSSFHCR